MLIQGNEKQPSTNLPTPEIVLNSQSESVTLDFADINTKAVWWQFKLFSYPTVTVLDIDENMIKKWLRLEFLYYRTSKSTRYNGRKWAKKFVHPSDFIWWAPTTNWAMTRWWYHVPWTMDRKSAWQVTWLWQVIPLYEWLAWRTWLVNVWYRDIWTTIQTLKCLVPIKRVKKYINQYVSRFYHYSSVYAPLYFRCRYAYFDWKNWISWPESKTFSMQSLVHPFEYDPQNSAIQWTSVCNIDPRYTHEAQACFDETWRLPTA